MLRRLAKIFGVLALVLVVIALVPLVQVEWQVREARTATQAADAPPAVDPASSAPVLILLHGAGLNGRMWDPVRRSLDPAYRVIAPDLPGHGVHRDGIYTLEGATQSIAAVARSVAPAPVVLVGDSLGGFSAMAAAPVIPREQLKGVVIASSSGNFKWSQLPSYVGGVLLVRALLLFFDEDKLAMKALGNFPLSDADKIAMIAGGVSLRAVAPAARSLMDVDFRTKLAAIDAPVLIVNGSLDHNAVEQEQSFLASAKHASLLHFENCEHGVSMRRPPEFAAAINAFVSRVTGPKP
jgi:pimeloyl-ACP methyl ester carboxylesterase